MTLKWQYNAAKMPPYVDKCHYNAPKMPLNVDKCQCNAPDGPKGSLNDTKMMITWK